MADQCLNTLFRRESKLKTLRKDSRSSKGYGGKTEYKGDIEGERKLVIGSKAVDKPVHLRYLYCAPWTGYIFNEVNLPLGAFHLDAGKASSE
jgi:hypothetical protein